MSYRKTDSVEICGEKVEVKELVPNEVANIMDEMKEYNPHVLDLLVNRDIPISVVTLSSGKDEAFLMAKPVSQLELLYDKVLEVNPSLAALTARLRKVVDQYQETVSGNVPASS